MSSGVSIRNLGIAFGPQKILQGLNLEVRDGEFLVLLGPSGCGKSTLLHGIAGLVEVAEGSVAIGGEDVTDADPSRRHIGMVFQSYALYPTMTVEKNLSFGLRVAGLPRAEIARRVDAAARMLQLTPLLHRKPAALSGGQRQRVAIGRALVRDAKVFLFDEPLSNLDAQLRTELRRELKLLHQKLGTTMIHVTHDQVEAMTLADRIVVMRAGCIQQIGAPAEVYDRPANLFVAGFLGAPAMNFIHGQLQRQNGGWAFVAERFTLEVSAHAFAALPAEGQAVVLGLRPEHLRLTPQGAFQGLVELVEPMGNHQVVWLRCGSHGLALLRHETTPLAVGETLRFDIHNDKLSLFDRDRETRL